MKKVLVVGGSKGIGLSIVKKLSDICEIHNISRTPVPLDGGFVHHQLDVCKDELPDIEDLSALIYCPGSITLKPISSLKEENYREDLEINVMGAIRCIKAYHRKMARQENASITLFSTVAVTQGMPFHSSVAVAKGAVEGLTKSLAAELAPKIRVNCIAPTITDTPLAAGLLRNDAARDRMKERHPLKTILAPEDLSEMAVYLTSDKGRAITGQIMNIDAGLSTLKI